jgi:hypothetical protein
MHRIRNGPLWGTKRGDIVAQNLIITHCIWNCRVTTLISSKHFHYSEFLHHIRQEGRIASSLPSAKHPNAGERQREWTVQSPSAAWPLKHGDAAKAILAELGVVLGILDILVAHPFLNHAQVDPVIYQPMAATMA